MGGSFKHIQIRTERNWISICVLSVTIGNKIVFGPKIIRTTHPRTKEKIKTSILPYLSYPPKFRFRPDVEAKNEVLRRYVDTFVYSLSNAFIYTHIYNFISVSNTSHIFLVFFIQLLVGSSSTAVYLFKHALFLSSSSFVLPTSTVQMQ